MDAEAGQGVEIDRQGGNEGLALAGLHLRDQPAVQGDAADELDVEVHHVPHQRLAVDEHPAAAQATRGVLHHRVGLGHDLLQILRARHVEAFLDPQERGLRGFDGFQRGFDPGGQRREFPAQ